MCLLFLFKIYDFFHQFCNSQRLLRVKIGNTIFFVLNFEQRLPTNVLPIPKGSEGLQENK